MGRMKLIVVGRLITLIVPLFALVGPALAQKPTQAQIGAIRQACRSDYQTYCSSVPTGGSAALACLQQNAQSVSAPCQQALGGASGSAPAQSQKPAPASGCTRIEPAGICLPRPSAADVAAAGGDAAAALLRPGLSGLLRRRPTWWRPDHRLPASE